MKILQAPFLLCFLFLCFNVIAQDEKLMNNVIPPSPNAASLGLYGEIPVDKQNGVPNISIPLYTIQVDDITVPVSLSFHASTHKVGMTASSVGYGWSLNAGGVVSRSMQGGADESGFFINIDSVLAWERDNILENVYDPYLPGSSQRIKNLKERMWQTHFNGWDTQPDVFYYNFSAGAGKFAFKKDVSAVQMPFQDHTIQPIGFVPGDNYTNKGKLDGFLVKDMSGLVYTFDKPEKTHVNYGNFGGKPDDVFNSSWYLSRIYSQRSNKAVDFSYTSPVQLYDVPNTSNTIIERIPQLASGDYSVSYPDASSTLSIIDCIYLNSISWEGGTIHFYYSDGRTDIVSGGQKLDSIRITNRTGEWIKSFRMSYGYFNTNAQLKLLSVTEKGNDGKSLPPYTFDYYDGSLPPHNTNAQDYLGYFNDAPNSNLIPGYTNALGNPVEGANRQPNPAVAKAGILNVMHYPTGGYTEFIYEGHDYYAGQTPLIPGSTSDRSNVAAAEYCFDDNFLYYDQNGYAKMGLHCERSKTQTFTIPAQSSNFKITIAFYCDPVTPPSINPGDLSVKIFEGQDVDPVFENNPTSAVTQTLTLTGTVSSNKTYTLFVETKIQGTMLIATLSYTTTIPPSGNTANNVKLSGVRIANINQYDDKGLARSIHYTYRQKDHSDRSSGVLLAHNPTYQYEYTQTESPAEGSVNYIVHNASPAGLLGSFQGSHIVYSEVVESETGHGQTRSYYSTYFQQPALKFYFTPASFEPPSFFWKNGNLIQEEISDQTGMLLKSVTHNYSYLNVDTVAGFVFGLYDDPGTETYQKSFSYAVTRQYSGWPRLESSVETSYSNSNGLVSTTTYQYQNGLILPGYTEYSTSDGVSRHDEVDYLNDRTNHVISPVLESRAYKGTTLMSRKKYNYSQGKITSIQEFSTDNILMHTISYSGYNGLKPSYVESTSGIRIAYLWGYNNTLPIAKATNASPDELFYEGFETIGVQNVLAHTGKRLYDGDYTFTPSPDFTPDANSIISYWYWDGSEWYHTSKPYHGGSVIIQDGLMIEDVLICPADAQVELYTFREGVGMSSACDSNGDATNYEYDSFGRLKTILDYKKNIVKTFDYNLQGQAGIYNYVKETSILQQVTDLAQTGSLSVFGKHTDASYYDGLGRLRQHVSAQGSPARYDVVQPVIYDAFGRETTHYLPYVSSDQNGGYKDDAINLTNYPSSQQSIFYNGGAAGTIVQDTKPFTTKLYEESPLNRVIKQGSEGSTWQPNTSSYTSPTDHALAMSYALNIANEVKFFTYDATTGSVNQSGYYGINLLHANKTKDEHGNEVTAFIDKEDRVVCKKVQYGVDGSGKRLYAETYYLYNNAGKLAIVLPPEAVKALTSAQ